MTKRTEEFSLKELVTLFIPKLWVIILVAFLASSALGVYSAMFKDDSYTSKATIHIVKQNSNMSSGDLDVVSKVIEDYKILVKTDNFLTYVLEDVHSSPECVKNNWKIDSSYIKRHMSAIDITDDILEISVTTDDKAKSYLLATVLSEVIVEKSVDLFAFEDTLTLKILNHPTPNEANSKNVARNSIFGFIGGALLAMVVIFILDQFDTAVHDKKKLEETFDLPIIGLIPRYDIEEDKQDV